MSRPNSRARHDRAIPRFNREQGLDLLDEAARWDAGWAACQRGEAFDPHQDDAWRAGWKAAQAP